MLAYDPLPPFQWSKTDFKDLPHYGMPDKFEFEPLIHQWKWLWMMSKKAQSIEQTHKYKWGQLLHYSQNAFYFNFLLSDELFPIKFDKIYDFRSFTRSFGF